MAIAVGFSGVAGSGAGVRLVQETAGAACDLLLAPREVSVNRDRLLAAWALANVTSVLELYRYWTVAILISEVTGKYRKEWPSECNYA